jgi:DNA-binding transcriptional MerR regulator
VTEPATAYERSTDKAPDAYRTISEVALELSLPQHVLRFWESRFGQIRPLKRGGGRRYYKPEDIALLKGIQHLLYNEGYTIKGVQKVLKTQGVRAVQGLSSGSLRKIEFANDEGETQSAEIVELREPVLEDLEVEGQDNVPADSALEEDEVEPHPAIAAELANQLPLFEQSAANGPENKQQLADVAKRLRAVRKDLVDMRDELKKTGEQK